jgi:hypothetical protein
MENQRTKTSEEGWLGKRREPLIAIPEPNRPLHGWSKEEVTFNSSRNEWSVNSRRIPGSRIGRRSLLSFQ